MKAARTEYSQEEMFHAAVFAARRLGRLPAHPDGAACFSQSRLTDYSYELKDQSGQELASVQMRDVIYFARKARSNNGILASILTGRHSLAVRLLGAAYYGMTALVYMGLMPLQGARFDPSRPPELFFLALSALCIGSLLLRKSSYRRLNLRILLLATDVTLKVLLYLALTAAASGASAFGQRYWPWVSVFFHFIPVLIFFVGPPLALLILFSRAWTDDLFPST